MPRTARRRRCMPLERLSWQEVRLDDWFELFYLIVGMHSIAIGPGTEADHHRRSAGLHQLLLPVPDPDDTRVRSEERKRCVLFPVSRRVRGGSC